MEDQPHINAKTIRQIIREDLKNTRSFVPNSTTDEQKARGALCINCIVIGETSLGYIIRIVKKKARVWSGE